MRFKNFAGCLLKSCMYIPFLFISFLLFVTLINFLFFFFFPLFSNKQPFNASAGNIYISLLNVNSSDSTLSYFLPKSKDVYSLGMILWEILTCRIPFDHLDTLGSEDRNRAILVCHIQHTHWPDCWFFMTHKGRRATPDSGYHQWWWNCKCICCIDQKLLDAWSCSGLDWKKITV